MISSSGAAGVAGSRAIYAGSVLQHGQRRGRFLRELAATAGTAVKIVLVSRVTGEKESCEVGLRLCWDCGLVQLLSISCLWI